MAIRINYDNAFVKEAEIAQLEPKIKEIHSALHSKTGAGNDFLGWLDAPISYYDEELEKVNNIKDKIIDDCDVFVVVGIGGSYLGAKACFELLSHSFHNLLSKDMRKGAKIVFVGHTLSSKYTKELIDILDGQSVYVNVISKSGKTIEPAMAFRFIRDYMEKRYGSESKKRIIVTTDKSKGALKPLADMEGYDSLVVPDDIGGRYSVLTPVGLLPLAMAGIDCGAMINGAKAAYNDLLEDNLLANSAYLYSTLRLINYSKGKTVETLVGYEPRFSSFGEWFKQLFGESEGKEKKGLLPNYMGFTTDLHSLGQFVQDGNPILFETLLRVDCPDNLVSIPFTKDNLDGLNYLEGVSFDKVNEMAYLGTLKAHIGSDVPNIIIHLEKVDPYNVGYLLYWMMKSCAVGGYLLEVNPFDQPGVEAYKVNMMELLSDLKKEE